MVSMDQTDLKNWARNNHHKFNGAPHQYLLGNRGIEECLISIIDELHPLRDTSEILKMIKDRVEEVEEGVDDWTSWLDELEHKIKGLKTLDPVPQGPLPLEEKRSTPSPPFHFLDLIENGTDLHKGNPLYGTFQGRYYPRVSKEATVRVLEHYGLEGDPRKSVGMILPVRKHKEEEYVLIPPQTTVTLNTVERVRMGPSVVVVMGGHPTYQAIGLETRGGVFGLKEVSVGGIEIQMTNPKSTPARVYMGHGACELMFIPLGR